MTDDSEPRLRFLRKKHIQDDLGLDRGTLNKWIREGRIPSPQILNPNSGREIGVWDEAEYLQWRSSLPRRMPKPASDAAYAARREQAAQRRAARQQAISTDCRNSPTTAGERSPTATEPVRSRLTRPQ
jgi:hypothetical protein